MYSSFENRHNILYKPAQNLCSHPFITRDKVSSLPQFLLKKFVPLLNHLASDWWLGFCFDLKIIYVRHFSFLELLHFLRSFHSHFLSLALNRLILHLVDFDTPYLLRRSGTFSNFLEHYIYTRTIIIISSKLYNLPLVYLNNNASFNILCISPR